MQITVNGHNAATLPAMFVFAMSPNGSDAIYQMKIPKQRQAQEHMLDAMRMCIQKVEREINR